MMDLKRAKEANAGYLGITSDSLLDIDISGGAAGPLTRFTLHNPHEGTSIKSRLEQEHGLEVIESTDGAKNLLQVFAPSSFKDSLTDMGLNLLDINEGRSFQAVQAVNPELQIYHNRSALAHLFDELVARYPHLATMIDITAKYKLPSTERGNHIFAMKISDNVESDEPEHNVLLVSNHHAREIVVPEVALYIANELLSHYATDTSIKKVVDNLQIYIIYTMNPDGLDIVWNENRWNRLNARGVDLNRNYPVGWGAECGGSTLKGSETYRGVAPFSEVETQTMRALQADRHFAKLIDFHSFSQQVRHGYAKCGMLDERIQKHFKDLASVIAGEMMYFEADSCCLGGDISWAYQSHGSTPILIETAMDFQPERKDLEPELKYVWKGVKKFLEYPIPVSGTIVSKADGKPIAGAELLLPEYKWMLNETKPVRDDGVFHLWVPEGKLQLAVKHGNGVHHVEAVDVDANGKVLQIKI